MSPLSNYILMFGRYEAACNYLNRYSPLTRSHFPRADDFMILDNRCAGIESHGRTDMARHAIKAASNFKLSRIGRFDDEMFFTMSDCVVIRQVEKLDAWVRHF